MAANIDDVNSDIDSIRSLDDTEIQLSMKISKLMEDLRKAKFDFETLKNEKELQEKLAKEAQYKENLAKQKQQEEQLLLGQALDKLSAEKAASEKKEEAARMEAEKLRIELDTARREHESMMMTERRLRQLAEKDRDRYKTQTQASSTGKFPPGTPRM